MTAAPDWFRFLGSPSSPADLAWCFSDQKSIHTRPLVSREPITIIPGFGDMRHGVESFDPPFLLMLRELTDELNKEFHVDLDSGGYVGASGIHQNFDRLKTVAGYSMSPMSLAPVDNSRFVESLGLPGDFRTARHREIFDEFISRVFSQWKVSSVKTAKLSTAGAPTWMSSARMKREHALFLLGNDERVRRIWADRDLVELARYARVVFLYNAGRRDQVDSVGKERLVFPREYALSSGAKGHPIVADKRVIIDGQEYPDFSATRARLFHGGPYPANLIPQIIATGTMYGGLFDRYAPTFHCTDVERMAAGIGLDEEVVASDATEYDRSCATFLLKRLFTIARKFWDSEWIDWCEQLCFAAYFSRPVGLDPKDPSNRPLLVGNHFSATHQVFRGNPSGFGWTALIAKLLMVFDFLATVDDLHHDVKERMDDYLLHRMPLKTHNNGDDGLYRGHRRALRQYADYRFGDDNPGYFVLKREIGHVWSGYLFAPQEGGGYKAYHRLHTTFEKMFVPERSAGSNFRPHWTTGLLQRINFGTNPSHSKAIEILSRVWHDHAAPHYGGLMELINAHHDQITEDIDSWTMIDREVRDDPTKLYYKYQESDVSPHVLAAIFEKSLLPEEIMPFVEKYYAGRVYADESLAYKPTTTKGVSAPPVNGPPSSGILA